MDKEFHFRQLDHLIEIQKDDHHALRIAMCGKFKSGKSSLLNLMLGVNLPVKATTATGIITKVIYGKKNAVKLQNGEIKKVSEEELYDYITVADKNLDGIAIGDAEYAYIGSRSKLLKHGKVEFWDTPGLEDDPELTKITMSAIQNSDFLIYVMPATQVLSQYEKRLFPKLYKLMNGNLIFVINYMDLLRKEEMDSVFSTVRDVLGNYTNKYLPNGSVYYTSANPDKPEINGLFNDITKIVEKKNNRIDLLNLTQQGKADVAVEEWQERISEDMENINKNLSKYKLLLKNDIEQKRNQLEASFKKCRSDFERIQKKLKSDISDENAWRMVLIKYQEIPEWEKNFVSGASQRIKERMEQLIQEANNEISNAVQGTIFYSDCGNIILDDKNVWKKANWYKNFSKPLLFSQKKFKQYCLDCINKTIGALMANPVIVVEESITAYFTNMFSATLNHYHKALKEISGEPEILQQITSSEEEKTLIAEYQENISDIREDIRTASHRNKFSYKLKDFFSFFFTGMLSNERSC